MNRRRALIALASLLLALVGIFWIANRKESNEKPPHESPPTEPRESPPATASAPVAATAPPREKTPESRNADFRKVGSESRESSAIRGRVVFKGLGIVGVRVLALPNAALRDLATVEAALKAEHNPALVTSDADGRFVIAGLDPDHKYGLLVGGSGYGAAGFYLDIAVDGEELTIPVRPIYGAVVAIRPKGADAFPTGPDIFSHPGVNTGPPPTKNSSSISNLNLLIHGLPRELLGRSVWNPRPLVYLSDEDKESLEPVRFTMNFPGFESAKASLMLPRITGEITRQEIRVDQRAAGFSNVTVELVELLRSEIPPFDRRKQGTPVGLLEFRGKEGADSFDFFIWSVDSPTQLLKGIPYGTYEVRFSAAYGFHHGRATLVTISHPEERVTIPILPENSNDVGSLLLRVRGADGVEYHGVLLVVCRKKGGGSTFVPFSSDPYLIEYLPAEPINLKIVPSDMPRVRGVPPQIDSEVTIQSRRQTEHEIQVKG